MQEVIFLKGNCRIDGERTTESSSTTTIKDEPRSSREMDEMEEAAYDAWLVSHPSALVAFDEMMSGAKEEEELKVAVFLDYDGTLAPIVDDPDRAFISDSMRSVLDKVAQHFPTFIISGRTRDKVYEFVKLTNVYYVGSHGLDMDMDMMTTTMTMPQLKNSHSLPPPPRFHPMINNNINTNTNHHRQGDEVMCFRQAQELLPLIRQAYWELVRKTKEINGVLIENNKYCITVHFRRVHQQDWHILESQVINIIQEYPSLHITRGKKVMEVRPSIKWDKGRALEYLLESLGYKNDQTLSFYIGDDRTDEDAFRVLQRKRLGYPIIVSCTPKATKASYSLRDPSEVMSFLLHLIRWKRSS